MTPKIFLDLDGVMVNLELPIYVQHGVVFGKTHEWELEQVWLKTTEEFWATCPPEDDYEALYSIISHLDPVVLTAVPHTFKQGSSQSMTCELGKRKWVHDNLSPRQASRMIVTYSKLKQEVIPKDIDHKHLYILIDDMKRNIERWQAAGGTGILHTSAADTIKQLQAIDFLNLTSGTTS